MSSVSDPHFNALVDSWLCTVVNSCELTGALSVAEAAWLWPSISTPLFTVSDDFCVDVNKGPDLSVWPARSQVNFFFGLSALCSGGET